MQFITSTRSYSFDMNISSDMDFSSDNPTGKSPKRERELQGPRPTPLKIRKDSYKVRKPPLVPHPSQPTAPPPCPPVIIYAVSPKVIHIHQSEFMSLVQRLTGVSSTYVPSPPTRAISPAARLASVEKARLPEGKKSRVKVGDLEGIEADHGVVEKTGSIPPGILSPGPGSLQPIPLTLFSPSSDMTNPVGLFQDVSITKNGIDEGGFWLQSPSNNFITPRITTSPTFSPNFFSNFFDF